MAPLEVVLFWITAVAYALATGALLYAMVFRNDRWAAPALLLVGLGFLLHTATIGARFAAQGHLPWAGDYENGLAGSWFIVGGTLGVALRKRAHGVLALGTVPFALLLLGYGYMRQPALGPMAAALKSPWLYIHVYFAWLAFGAYALAMSSGILWLVKRRAAARPSADAGSERFPSPERLDELAFRYVVFGFIADAVMIASGAIWAKDLWGSYWSWDPVETWSLVTFLTYGIAIHLRLTRGWRGARFAWLVIGAILGNLMAFFGVSFAVETSNHIFNVR
ncbi:MAG TPA: cytochrome c biogenesis protein CcsA [Anaeromyxobacteraceae bacterium]|nr:cytochrome c biogenesis protein CcsA [Anaeromyxobacteraceae bacterium]